MDTAIDAAQETKHQEEAPRIEGPAMQREKAHDAGERESAQQGGVIAPEPDLEETEAGSAGEDTAGAGQHERDGKGVALWQEEKPQEEGSETADLRAENCIKNHVMAAMGVGLVPSALVDVVGITAIEVKMIRELALIYHFPVPNKLVAYKVLISLIGSLGPVYFSTRMHSALKGVPLIGHAVYVGLWSVAGGAAVYAVGKIFQKHYQSGGIFLSKDNRYIRTYFRKKYAEGQEIVKGYAT